MSEEDVFNANFNILSVISWRSGLLMEEILCMFGLLQNSKSVNIYFVNNIIAIRKFCIIKRRYFAIGEGNILNIENYFRLTVLNKGSWIYNYQEYFMPEHHIKNTLYIH
jgi:hypothetical protein